MQPYPLQMCLGGSCCWWKVADISSGKLVCVVKTIRVISLITVTILITDLRPRNYLPPAIRAAIIVSPTLSLVDTTMTEQQQL